MCMIARLVYNRIHYLIRYLLSKRKYRIFLKTFLSFAFIILIYHSYIYTVEQFFFHWNYVAFLEDYPYADASRTSCILPRLDPWDDRAKRYFFKVPPIMCDQVQPYLTEVTIDGVLRWNKTETQIPNIQSTLTKLVCSYQEILKHNQTDDAIILTEPKQFLGYAQLTQSFANVSCLLNGALYYHNIHAWVPKSVYQKLTPSSTRPSVQIFILDSVSHSNFIRQLPSTYKILTEEMSSVVLNGLIKVGGNTFPNVGAMLTGKYVYGTRLPSSDQGFDPWPIAWKNFSSIGYATILGEDHPEYNTFNYVHIGFRKNPTDIYMRPFWLAVADPKGPLYSQSSYYCYGNQAEYQIMLDFLKRATETLSGYPYFMFTNLMKLSHDELNSLQVVDGELSSFFKWFRETAKNTILIVMGDHGINFGSFRSTQLGRVESAFPFFSISLPERLRKLYPHLEKNLLTNRNRMASWYDVYDTLMDVVSSRYDKPRHSWSEKGFSLFYQLPVQRTCEDAGIPEDYCPCEIEIPLAVNSSLEVKLAGESLVESINGILSVEPRCPPLSLLSVKSAIKILPNMSTAKAKGFRNVFRIVIEVLPSHALFEAIMKNDAWDKEFSPLGSITRLDRFGNTTRCVDDTYLRNFCYCDKS